MRLLATTAFVCLMAAPTALAQTVTPQSGTPTVSGNNLIFTLNTNGIQLGDGAAIELNPLGTNTYNRYACVFTSGGFPDAVYTCTVDATTLPAEYQNTTVRYQTYVSDYGQPNSNTFNFSGFNYSYQSNGSALPVELVSFTAAANGRSARLAWTTASETNNAGFVVERQTSADAWADASGLIAGHGTTTERQSYSFSVDGLTAGTHVFRLRQTDTDGTVHYSAPTSVEIGVAGEGALTLLGSRAVRIETNGAQAVRVSVVDVLGRTVAMQSASVSGTMEVALPSLSSGTYFVRAQGERFSATKTLVVR